jgi:Cu(I)/Ag(I) efflux system membrane fusion protein/cobalt-zinc-cadmium efflux system membrane fusion protein
MSHARTRTLTAALFAFALAVPSFAQAQAAATQKPTVDIVLMSKPSPPKMGDNTFEVMLKGLDGTPITDADVSVTFFMAAMPAMKMPEMKNTVALKHMKDGMYSATGKVMMAGMWDATVAVKRGGKEVASKKFPITAK